MMENIKRTLILLLLFLAGPNQLFAVTEQQLKAAYLYNVTKFIHWSQSSFKTEDAPINICIIGKDFFKENLEPLKGKSVGGRKFNVSYYAHSKEVGQCHVAYISRSKMKNFKGELKELEGKKMVTISDIYGFSDRGGMIELRKQENKIRLFVNLQKLKSEELSLSAKLLELCTIVKGEPK